MGYSTDFRGEFDLNTKLDLDTFNLLRGLATTRRMARNLPPAYGIEGELYCEDRGNFGQDETPDVIDGNRPPKTQPSLWCQWTPTDDGLHIEWDGGEKFYAYIDWIEYLIAKVLAPRGYVLNGEVDWVGDDVFDDRGTISISNNVVTIKNNS